MKPFILLLKIQLLGLFGINKTLHEMCIRDRHVAHVDELVEQLGVVLAQLVELALREREQHGVLRGDEARFVAAEGRVVVVLGGEGVARVAPVQRLSLIHIYKDRPKHNQAEITALIGNVHGKVCILNDDMIDTAGSLVAAATTLKAKGAEKVYACATHGLFSGPAYERIANSSIEEVVVTNAVPVPLERQTGKVKVLSVGPLFAKTLSLIHI